MIDSFDTHFPFSGRSFLAGHHLYVVTRKAYTIFLLHHELYILVHFTFETWNAEESKMVLLQPFVTSSHIFVEECKECQDFQGFN